VEALFTIGEIYRDDLKDPEQAKATFQDYLKHYPHSQLAPKAMQALAEINDADGAPSPFKKKGSKAQRTQHASGPKAAWADVTPSSKPAIKKNQPKPEIKVADAKAAKPKSNESNADADDSSTVSADEAAAPSPQAQPQPAQDASLSGPGLPPLNRMPRLTSIRSWSTPDYVRVAIDLEQEVKYQAGRVPRPDRIFFDLYGVKLASDLVGKSFDVEAGFLHKIRVAQYKANMARVVLDVDDVAEYSAFLLPNPYRLIIDIHGKMPARQVASANRDNSNSVTSTPTNETKSQQDSKSAVQDAMQSGTNARNSGKPAASPTSANVPSANSVANNPSAGKIKALARGLGVDPHTLFEVICGPLDKNVDDPRGEDVPEVGPFLELMQQVAENPALVKIVEEAVLLLPGERAVVLKSLKSFNERKGRQEGDKSVRARK